MPVVFRHDGYKFFFYSNEGDPREPVHIHVRKGEAVAKFWIGPVNLAASDGFDAKTLRLLARLIEERSVLIERTWHDYFG
ncbi:DUF4160 domain-containing protein [Methylocystis parvus]|uniref:DUF4160 domain-containing protein n=1 Tax=Methylocystis parvus TaxID=134 RepID=A0A6B8M3S0_9HYPH|nr:DUF4160 domain-containing protein [Methylocystis parvus]QGM96752.1 DUF4160 domain-containing protein [Methylocystis parvus]WBJ99372.1 DUF4160 domain-containing protein [Methylocystis parvus OBBP]